MSSKLPKLAAILIGLIIAFGVIVRFYNFSDRIIYGPEQARSLIVATRYIKEKPSLLGQEYFRISSKGHKLFYSALFPYSLIPLLLSVKYDLLLTTAFFAILNIFTGLATFFVARRMFNIKTAFFALILFTFSSLMIYHSLFLWPYNYLPIIGLGSLYTLYLYKNDENYKYGFFLGILSGIGFGLQYVYSVYALIIFLIILFLSSAKLKASLFFLGGAILGNFPMVIFDLRHDFYHTRTLFQYLVDTLQGRTGEFSNYYYLLPLAPLFAIIGGIFIRWIYTKSKYLSILIVALYILVNIISPKVNFHRSLGMPEGLTWRDIYRAAEVIAKDEPDDFNVVTLLDFDTRAYVLRYPLESLYSLKPKGDEDYPNSKHVYVLARNDYDFSSPKVWELETIQPFEVITLAVIKSEYSVSKLSRKNE